MRGRWPTEGTEGGAKLQVEQWRDNHAMRNIQMASYFFNYLNIMFQLFGCVLCERSGNGEVNV